MACPRCKQSGQKQKGEWMVCANCGAEITKATQPKRGWVKDARRERKGKK